MSMPARVLNSSTARCDEVPLPNEAKLSLPGLALASATSWLTVLASKLGCAISTWFTRATSETGVKSLIGSQGAFCISIGTSTKLLAMKSNV